MVAPLVALAVLAVGGGLINAPRLLPLTRFLQKTLADIEEPEFIAAIAILTTLLAVVSIGLAWLLYGRRPIKSRAPDPLQSRLGPVWIAIRHRWWVDEFYDWLIVRRYVSLARSFGPPIGWPAYSISGLSIVDSMAWGRLRAGAPVG